MLILIAGITGNIGQHAARHALKRGHDVRGLGRTPTKLAPDISAKLESFTTSTTYYDMAALEAACAGVDAVLCAYSGTPELHLDAQLLLFRTAERSGIKRYLAAGWNYDWRNIPFQSEPVYDAAMMFHAQMSISSTRPENPLRPLHIFSGMLVDVFFGPYFTPTNYGVWDPNHVGGKRMEIYGTGDEVWQFTTEHDAGAWGVEVLTAANAEEGGFVSLCSFEMSLNELRATYEKVRQQEIQVEMMGGPEVLMKRADDIRAKVGREGFWSWHSNVFHANCLTGVWNMKDLQNSQYPAVEAQTLEEWLKDHPEA